MSDYFNGLQLRAIDSDAAANGEPMSAALEAQLANNNDYLHRIGGGSVVKLGAPEGSGIGDDNSVQIAAVGIASLHHQPFLVTRGLSEVRIDWHGRVEFYPLDVRLELVGVGVVDATWGVGGANNVARSIVLTLPAPAEYEFETRLVLWQIGKPGAPDGGGNLGILNEGVAEMPQGSGILSDEFARCLLIGSSGAPYEPLTRAIPDPVDPALTPDAFLSNGDPGEVAITTSAASGSALRIREAELARVATRSVQVTLRHL